MGLVLAPPRAHGVAGAARGVDHDVRGQERSPLTGKAELCEQRGNVFLVRLRRGVFLAHDLVELRLRIFPASPESVVPDVKRLELAAKALLHELCDTRNLGGNQ